MRRVRCVLWLALATLLFADRSHAAGGAEVEIYLLTMGPGEHLYTRAGHAALMVAEMRDGRPERTVVYNYGATDWNRSSLAGDVLQGRAVFFLERVGDIVEVVNDYALRQGRSVYRQRLRLTPGQVKLVARRLEHESLRGNSDYILHHTNTTCSSKILDLLDDVLGGPIRRQLASKPGPKTWREHFHWGLSGDHLVSIAVDLFLGRFHDRPLGLHATTVIPAEMRTILQGVRVPDPSGGGKLVGLAEPPIAMSLRKVPVVTSESWISHWLWGLLSLLAAFGGVTAYREAPRDRRPAGKLLLGVALGSGLVGLAVMAFMFVTRVPELRQNELFLVFPASDLLMLPTALRWIGGGRSSARALLPYWRFRAGFMALVVAGHLAAVLYQRPLILLLLGVVVAVSGWVVVERLARTAAVEPAQFLAPLPGAGPGRAQS